MAIWNPGHPEHIKISENGKEILINSSEAELKRGVRLTTTWTKYKFIVHKDIFRLNLKINPNNMINNDKFILFSTDKGKSYYKEQTIEDDIIPGDNMLSLEYDSIIKDLNYSLLVKLEANGYSYFVFKDIPYSRLVGKKGESLNV